MSKENSIVLSEMGISVGEDDKDLIDINLKLKSKLKQKQDELEKVEYDLAKAKADHIKIMRELVRFPSDFKNLYSLRSRLVQVKKACIALKDQRRVSIVELNKEKNFLNDLKSRYEKVKGKIIVLIYLEFQREARKEVGFEEVSKRFNF